MSGIVRRVRERAGPGSVQEGRRTAAGRVTTVGVCLVAGLMITVSAFAARGQDLRGDRASDLRALAESQHARAVELRATATDLRAEVDALGAQDPVSEELQGEIQAAALAASVLPVTGPAVRVTLTDAPADVKPAGVDDDALVVHQQDIQAVVNALWAGGAEAMTIQDQRVIATTGIKCVGNTVVLNGVPYAPPYVIVAIGDQESLDSALEESPALQIYRQYVAVYGLGYDQERLERVELPGFIGSVGLSHAQPAP